MKPIGARAKTAASDVAESFGVSAAATVVIAFLFSLVALADLNALLAGMHVEGSAGHTIGDLASILHPGEARERAADVIESWREWERDYDTKVGPDVISPLWVAALHAILDTFPFVAAYAAALVVFFRHVERSNATADEVSVARWGARGALALAAADVVENVLEILVLLDGWGEAWPDEEIAIGVSALFLTIAATIKWLLAALVVVTAIAVAWVRLGRWRGSNGLATFRRALFRLRLHLVPVALFMVVLLVHEQLPDLIRRWTIVQLGWAVAATALFAGVVWVSASVLLALGPRTEPAMTAASDGSALSGRRYGARGRRVLTLVYAASVVIVAAAVVDAATNSWFEFGFPWGLAIPAASVLLVALAGRVFEDAAIVEDEPAPPVQRESLGYGLTRVLPAAVIVALGLAVFRASFGYAIFLEQWTWWVLFVAVVIAAAILVGLLVYAGRPDDLAEAAREPWWLRLIRIPLSWGVLGALAAFVVLRIWADGELNASLLVVAALFLAYAGWFTYNLLAQFSGHARPLIWVALILGLGLVAVLWGAAIKGPWFTARELGGVAILGGFCAALTFGAWAIVHMTDGVPPPGALRALQFRRTPIVAFLVAWLLLASALDSGGYHEIRLAGSAQGRGVTLEEVWECWKQKNGLVRRDESLCTQRLPERASLVRARSMPLVFVSTSGGGIRAAFWTAYVLDCALEVDVDRATDETPCLGGPRTDGFSRSDAVVAMSGISGGSLGLAGYAAYLTEKQGTASPGWQVTRLDDDSLSASVAWWLFVEAPWSLARFGGVMDRAAVLERGWEEDWRRESGIDSLGRPFLALWDDEPHVPLLLLNGTSVVDGCRFSVSPLDASITAREGAREDDLERCRSTDAFEETDSTTAADLSDAHVQDRSSLGASRELIDFLCGGATDIPLSTAALLSARFPLVSPAGRVRQPCGKNRVSYVVDGGYLDTSGASPVIELLDRLQPRIRAWNRANPDRCVIPFLIQIDNGADSPRGDLSRRPPELLVPLKTVLAARVGRAADARTEAALLFNTRFGQTTFADRPLRDRYAHFVNLAHPGPQPPLGWTLSDFSRRDLRGQLGQSRNVDAMNEVRTWFAAASEGRLACRAPT